MTEERKYYAEETVEMKKVGNEEAQTPPYSKNVKENWW